MNHDIDVTNGFNSPTSGRMPARRAPSTRKNVPKLQSLTVADEKRYERLLEVEDSRGGLGVIKRTLTAGVVKHR